MIHKRHKLLIIIIPVLVIFSIFTNGCGRNGQTHSDVDSTKIQQIEEMQRRGSNLRNESRFEEAIATHDSCIQMAEDIHDTIQLVIALNNQGTNYRRLSALKEASDYHYRALALCDAFSDTTTFDAKKNRVRSLNGLGNILMELGNYDAAEEMFRRALAGEHNLGSATGQAINLANIGSIKNTLGQTDSARIYYNESMEMNRKDSNIVGICLCYTYFGELDQKAGHNSDALKNFRQSYLIGRTTGDIWHWLTPCISLAKLYINTAQADSASKYIETGINAADSIHSNEHLRDLYSLRSELYDIKGNTPKALSDLKLCQAYNDSVMNEEARNSVQNTRVNYEANRRNIEVQQAEDDAKMSRITRNAVIVSAFLLIILIGVILFFRHRSREAKEKAAREREIFYRNVTHQLRTPITVVIGMVEQLKDHIPADDVIGTESLNATKRQSKNLLELIKQLIVASKEGTADMIISQGELVQPKNSNLSSEAIEKIKSRFHSSDKTKEDEESTKPHILIAEDTDDVAMMMATLLHDHGYEVKRAADGQEALELLQNSDLPDLLLTDIAMPRMDGLELMRHVREDDTMCHLPIIVASARVEDSERMEGYSAGAEVYLTKPFNPDELLLRVDKLLEQRERLRRSFSHLETVPASPESPASQESLENTESPADSESPDNTAATIETPHLEPDEQEFINKLNRYIDDNMLSGEVNTNFIADLMCASASTINRKIKNITGMPAATYIRDRRMMMAKRLLATTDKSIAEIEILCGFNTPGHFSRLFKSETGLAPSDYRQKNKK